MFDLTNAARAVGRTCGSTFYPAVPPLTYNAALRQAAYLHSKDMADNAYFSHTGLDGSTPGSRMAQAGYTNWTMSAENIAAGQATPQQVVNAWLASSGHCANIMRSTVEDLGVGYYNKPGSQYVHYWTQNFGAR